MENRDINDRIRESAGEFIAECDHHYRQQAHDAAETVAGLIPARGKVILLAGPSGSSKTTTAKFIGEYLQHFGVRCHIISLDDYYYNFDSGRYPLDEEGKEDLESPLGLDLRLLNRHMDALNSGKAEPDAYLMAGSIAFLRALKEGGFEAKLILQVHDELIVEAPEGEALPAEPSAPDYSIYLDPITEPEEGEGGPPDGDGDPS